MKQLSDWLKAERGRAAALARHLGVSQAFMSDMASGEKSIPVPLMAPIEVFTCRAVDRKTMCPDEWARIWPELAQPTPNEPKESAHG
jgi:DNA-binding transcriptional regulator YdaS (Cro superfamily)